MDEFHKELITKQSALIIKQRNELNHANAEIIRLKRENAMIENELRAMRIASVLNRFTINFTNPN